MSYHCECFFTGNSGVRTLPAASEIGIYTAAYFCGYFLGFGTTIGVTLLGGRSCSSGACGRGCNRGPTVPASCAGRARTQCKTNIIAKNAVTSARFITGAVYVCASPVLQKSLSELRECEFFENSLSRWPSLVPRGTISGITPNPGIAFHVEHSTPIKAQIGTRPIMETAPKNHPPTHPIFHLFSTVEAFFAAFHGRFQSSTKIPPLHRLVRSARHLIQDAFHRQCPVLHNAGTYL